MTLHPAPQRADQQRCGCDTSDAVDLLPPEVALDRALALARSRPEPAAEVLRLMQATGRVLAARVCATAPLPPFDNAAMDGYGFDPTALIGAGPWDLPIAGRVRAGDVPRPCPLGAAVRILTGAAVPPGVAAVIPQEAVAQIGDHSIRVHRRPAQGAHIRRAGEDLAGGTAILPAGRVIGPREAAALAAAGHGRVAVRSRLRVAHLTTGTELVEPGAPLAPGRIWDANRALIAAALAQPWIAPVDLGALPDDPVALSVALAAAAADADLVVTTGGVSAGDEDHMTRLVRAAGGTIHAMNLAMKPGKPVTLGRLGAALWLGLPGNPVAAFVTWTVLGAPLAAAMAGITDTEPRGVPARLAAAVAHRAGRCEFRPARLLGRGADGALLVDCLPGPGSHRIAQLAAADGLVLIPAGAMGLAAGEAVEFRPFWGEGVWR